MSNVVDLKLIELRCMLRGWQCSRRATSVDVIEVTVTSPSTVTYLIDKDGRHPVKRNIGVSIDELIYAPRHTSSNIITNPGLGWSTTRMNNNYSLHWCPTDAAPGVHSHVCLELYGDGTLMFPPRYASRLSVTEIIFANRAVIDMLAKLAEVKP